MRHALSTACAKIAAHATGACCSWPTRSARSGPSSPHDRAKLRTEKSQVAAILRQVAAMRAQGVAGATPVPTSRADAAALLEIAPDASAEEIERAFRAQIVRCHPDRVADLHPNIRGQAEGLTVALNAARELLLGTGARPRRRRPA